MCDCSGFVLWVLKISRHQPTLQFLQRDLGHCWLNTDGIICDARNPAGFFYAIPPTSSPLPADIIIYPGNFYARQIGWKGKGPRIGHVGILTGADKVIHCSSGNMRTYGDAIAVTDLSVFHAVPYTKVIRFSGVL
jgi:cell wall-associated NlpC family hydrolase